jgi:tight adherence protein B
LRTTLVAVLTGALVVAGATVVSAQDAGLRIEEVERAGNNLSFTIYKPPETTLALGDLEVTVNELHADELETETQTEVVPRGAVLVIDTSRSMEKPLEPGEQAPIAAAQAAAARFLEALRPDDEMGLIAFDEEPETLSVFSNDRSKLLQEVDNLETSAESGTALYGAVLEAVELVDNRALAQRNIVLLSDGASREEEATLEEARAEAIAAGATIHVVALASKDYDPETTAELAEDTGGRFLTTVDPAQLSALFESLARDLVTGYRVRLLDPDPTEDGLHIAVSAADQILVDTFERVPSAQELVEGSPLPLDELPREAVLLIVFVVAAALVALASESIRRKRLSPVHRLRWYEQPTGPEIDSEALINAAVLKRAKEVATALAARTGYLERIEHSIESAGMRWRPGEVIVASAGLALAGGLLLFSLGGLGWGLLGFVLGLVGPAGYIQHKATSRRRAFYEQLSDVLLLMSGALKAGYSLQQAVATVGEDAKPPASDEFRRTMAEVRLGASLDDALAALARRIGILDFEWSVLAIQIQREVGGNLAEILEIISETIRERERLRRQLRTLTAEGRLSGWVLGLMPFAMAGLLLLRAPGYLEPLYQTPLGLMMVGISGALMVVGILWMRKIVKVEV